MNPDEPPPSLSSPAIRSYDQEADPKAIDDDSYTPAMSFSGHFPGPGNSLIINEGSNRRLNISYHEQPLSRGGVRPLVGSQTSGGLNHYPSAQPPSFNDVRGQQKSITGSSLNRNQITEEDALAGVSLNASDFKRIDPNAFQKDK